MMIKCQGKENEIAKKWQCNDLRNSKYDPFADVTLTSAILERFMQPGVS
jgi:hypothetical protein